MKYDFGQGEEYFIYNPKGLQNTSANSGIKIAKDAITYVTSGIMDTNRNIFCLICKKGIKVLNKIAYDSSLVIYRISRAPERRIFYIDVGNLVKLKQNNTYVKLWEDIVTNLCTMLPLVRSETTENTCQ